ncbi:TPA: hypothetical protein IUV20_002587 [Enterococcus faecalis]|nr:hypothetical protein [Enterococcus faecalis]
MKKEGEQQLQECKYKRGDILLRTGNSKGAGYCYLVHDVKDGYLYLYGLGMKIHYTMVLFYFEKEPFVPTLYLSTSKQSKRGRYRNFVEPIASRRIGNSKAW